MSKFQRVITCVVTLILVFFGWYLADPQMALLHAPDAQRGPSGLYRLVPYMTYIFTVVITWFATAPRDPDRD